MLRYIFLDAKYYLIKSSNHENVALAQAKGVWSSTPKIEARLNRAFRVCVIVYQSVGGWAEISMLIDGEEAVPFLSGVRWSMKK